MAVKKPAPKLITNPTEFLGKLKLLTSLVQTIKESKEPNISFFSDKVCYSLNGVRIILDTPHPLEFTILLNDFNKILETYSHTSELCIEGVISPSKSTSSSVIFKATGYKNSLKYTKALPVNRNALMEDFELNDRISTTSEYSKDILSIDHGIHVVSALSEVITNTDIPNKSAEHTLYINLCIDTDDFGNPEKYRAVAVFKDKTMFSAIRQLNTIHDGYTSQESISYVLDRRHAIALNTIRKDIQNSELSFYIDTVNCVLKVQLESENLTIIFPIKPDTNYLIFRDKREGFAVYFTKATITREYVIDVCPDAEHDEKLYEETYEQIDSTLPSFVENYFNFTKFSMPPDIENLLKRAEIITGKIGGYKLNVHTEYVPEKNAYDMCMSVDGHEVSDTFEINLPVNDLKIADYSVQASVYYTFLSGYSLAVLATVNNPNTGELYVQSILGFGQYDVTEAFTMKALMASVSSELTNNPDIINSITSNSTINMITSDDDEDDDYLNDLDD